MSEEERSTRRLQAIGKGGMGKKEGGENNGKKDRKGSIIACQDRLCRTLSVGLNEGK